MSQAVRLRHGSLRGETEGSRRRVIEKRIENVEVLIKSLRSALPLIVEENGVEVYKGLLIETMDVEITED